MNVTLASLFVAVAMAVVQSSVVPVSTPETIDTPHLTVTTSASVASVSAGERLVLFVDIVPKAKMHVYAPEQKAYLPVSLRLDQNMAVAARAAMFPKGESFFFAPTSETQIVYSKPFRIEQPVTVKRGRAAGLLAFTGTLVYQACDDTVCYVPKKVPMRWTVMVR